MDDQAQDGDSKRWQQLLDILDDKLQLGLLEHLKRAKHYKFEGSVLYIESTETDYEYLEKDAVFQQLVLLAQDAIGIESVNISKCED